MKPYPAWQFTLFRLFFGLYLTWHFLALIPYAVELFGVNGLVKDPSLNFTAGLFPNPLALPLPDGVVIASVASLALASLLFTAGIARHAMAFYLWFGWTALFHRNNLISNPSLPYIGLLLLLTLLIPGGEPLSLRPRASSWAMPRWVFRTAWILLALGYTFSGYTKLASQSWVDGSALAYLLENPLARPGFLRNTLLALPESLLRLATWGTLALELLFAPLALWKPARPWVWGAMVALHLGILCVVDFADLTFGMLVIHAFTFDPRWLPLVTCKQGERVVIHAFTFDPRWLPLPACQTGGTPVPSSAT